MKNKSTANMFFFLIHQAYKELQVDYVYIANRVPKLYVNQFNCKHTITQHQEYKINLKKNMSLIKEKETYILIGEGIPGYGLES